MGIVEEDIARVRDATNLDDLIGSHLQLRRVGRRSVGLCPFHDENTPSFSVNTELGYYKCFGCGRSGDAITFVREIMHLDFVAAVEYLAGRAGISLRYTSRDESQSRSKLRKLIEIVGAAVDFYHQRLLSGSDADKARSYLRSRGFDGNDVRTYKIGYAPDDWDGLYRHLNVNQKVFIDAGLGFINRANKVQDHFRDRVLFPIFDVNGQPVGFGGRVLPDGQGPKYKNSFDSKVYSKSRLLYGLHRSKDEIVRADESIVCEGYTDVIGFDKIGIERSVATCGTALTEDHIKMLKRFGKKIVLAFDADAAGQAAAERIYEWERALDVDVAVAKLPSGKDPADLARTDPDLLRRAVEQATPFLGFRVERVLATADLSTPEGCVRAAEAAIPVVAEHPNPLVRDQYLMQISTQTNIALDQLRNTLEMQLRRPKRRTQTARQADNSLEADELRAKEMRQQAAAKVNSVEAKLLIMALNTPEEIPAWITSELFVDNTLAQIFQSLTQFGTGNLHGFIDSLDQFCQEVLSVLLVADEPADEPDRVVAHFLYNTGHSKVGELQLEAQKTGDSATLEKMTQLRLLLDQVRSTNFDLEVAQRLLPLLVTEVIT